MKKYFADNDYLDTDGDPRFAHVEVYLAADVDAREAQGTAVIKAQRERIAELEAEIEKRIDAYRLAHDQAMTNGQRAQELEKAARAVLALKPEWCQECGIGNTDEWLALKSLMETATK